MRTVAELSYAFRVSYGDCQEILRANLNEGSGPEKSVLQFLTFDQKQQILGVCLEICEMAYNVLHVRGLTRCDFAVPLIMDLKRKGPCFNTVDEI